VDWLTSFGDGLPSLVEPNGPWSVIQTFIPRVTAKKKAGVYVLLPTTRITRFSNIRSMPTYDFELKLVWPLSSGIGSAEEDLQAFYVAVDLLIRRILGPLSDKTHGGRFLSGAENPKYLEVNIDDPDTTIGSMAGFVGKVTYSADDNEFAN
jgi:hypothetical protein